MNNGSGGCRQAGCEQRALMGVNATRSRWPQAARVHANSLIPPVMPHPLVSCLRRASTALAAGLLLGVAAAATAAPSAALATAPVQLDADARLASFDGVVEAVRHTVLAAQVSGAVVALDVKVGDTVKAGQVLARIDARAADQSAAASDAQVQAARAALDIATKDFERQRQLFQKNYISQAALDSAESQFKSTQAQVAVQLSQAGATRTQTGFFVVKAPYGGIVSEVPVALGDMAMPGRALLTLYDPATLRVTIWVPQSAAGLAGLRSSAPSPTKDVAVKVQLPGLPAGRDWVVPTRTTVLPMLDAATHSVQVRLDLPARTGADTSALAPGLFARAWLPGATAGQARLSVPASAVVRRAEMTGLYVVGADGVALLRQVRLGAVSADKVEVLSGVSAGEQVALDPQKAARLH
jgi:RND family efflux transporter MFP subunit